MVINFIDNKINFRNIRKKLVLWCIQETRPTVSGTKIGRIELAAINNFNTFYDDTGKA